MNIEKFVLGAVFVAGALMPWAPAADEVHNVTRDTFHDSIQAAVTAAVAGDTLRVEASLGEGLVVIDKNLTLEGQTGAEVVTATASTTNSGDGKAWFLVNAGVNLQVRNLIFDGDNGGNGITVSQVFRHKGTGKFVNCTFQDIRFEDYVGTAIVAFGGNVDVDRCTFVEIERVGVLFFGNGITNAKCVNSSFLGLGNGDQANYGVEVNAGAVVEMRGNFFDDYSGIAALDDSASAGVLVTSEGGAGTAATLTGNVFTDCALGLAVGFLVTDTSIVDAQDNRFEGNTVGVASFGPAVNAPNNWWGDASGPEDPAGTVEADGTTHIDPADVVNADGIGDAVTDVRVDYTPWLLSEPNNPPTANDDGFEIFADSAGNTLDVLANDTALPDTGETLTVQGVGAGDAGGTLSVTAGSLSVTYTPLAGFTGIEHFTYTLSDGNGGTDTANVDVSVVAGVGGNSPPVAHVVTPPGGSVGLNGGEDFEFVVTATDADSDTLTYDWDFGDGTQTSGIELTNVIHAFAPGTYAVTVTVSDGNGGFDSVQIQAAVVGGVDDADLYVAKAAFAINWKAHAGTGAPKDTIAFAGNLNPGGMPLVLPNGSSVQVTVNDVDVLGGTKALDAKGSAKGVVGAASKFSFKVSPKNGKYAFKISGADLRTALPEVEDVLASGLSLPVRLGLDLFNTGITTGACEGQPNFIYTTKAGSASKGKFSFKKNPLLTGAYTALKTSAKESKAGGEHLVMSKGVLELGGGGPVVPDMGGAGTAITLEIGAKSITFNSNLLVKTANNLTLPKDAVPELTLFNLNNPKKTFAFKTAADLAGTGIPNAGSGDADHDLAIRLTMVVDGESVELDTTVELLRKDNNSKSWKR